MRVSDITRSRVLEVLRRKQDATDQARAEREASRAVHVSEKVTEAAAQRVSMRIGKAVAAAGEDGMSWSDARRVLASRDHRYFKDAVERLVSAGQIRVDDSGRGRHITHVTGR